MIDLHSHILPGLDHGAHDWDEAIMLCQVAVEDGIKTIAATPHINDVFPNTKEAILAVLAEMRHRVADAGLDIEIVEGGDYHISDDLGPDTVLTLGGNGRYFLLEFPYQILPPHSDNYVESLIRQGLTPVVTHPERIFAIHGREEKIEPLIKKGAVVQITGDSLTGNFGPDCRYSAVKMLKKGWVHIIASDAHWVDERRPELSEALKEATRIVGADKARALVEENPRKILAAEDL